MRPRIAPCVAMVANVMPQTDPEIVTDVSDLPASAHRAGRLSLAITQLTDRPAREQARLVSEWCDLLPSLDDVTQLEFFTRVNQAMFEAACRMPQLRHLFI